MIYNIFTWEVRVFIICEPNEIIWEIEVYQE